MVLETCLMHQLGGRRGSKEENQHIGCALKQSAYWSDGGVALPPTIPPSGPGCAFFPRSGSF